MKVISWNVSGLGGFEKRKEVRKRVGEKSAFILCLQETKLEQIDSFVCTSLWGSSYYGYSFNPSVGASSGLLVMWDVAEVEIHSSFTFDHVLAVRGKF